MTKGPIIRVAVNAPLSRLFDYRAPKAGVARPGCRIEVPFGRRTRVGVVIELADNSELPAARLKAARRMIDSEPLFTENDLWLIRFVSDYYHHPIGEVAAAAMPALLRQGKPLESTVGFLSLTAAGRDQDIDTMRKRAPKQAALLETLRDADTISFPDLDVALPGWRRAKKGLIEKGLASEYESVAPATGNPLANVVNIVKPITPSMEAAIRSSMRVKPFLEFRGRGLKDLRKPGLTSNSLILYPKSFLLLFFDLFDHIRF